MNEGEQESVFEQPAAAVLPSAAQSSEAGSDHRRRRRGRRGGRGRHKGARGTAPATSTPVAPAAPPSMFDRFAEPSAVPVARAVRTRGGRSARVLDPRTGARSRDFRSWIPPRPAFAPAIPRFHRAHGAKLESQLRRLRSPAQCARSIKPMKRPPAPASS